MPPEDWSMSKYVGHFPDYDRYGGTPVTVDNVVPGQVFLGSIKMQAEQALENKPVNIPPPWSLLLSVPVSKVLASSSCPDFPSLWTLIKTCSLE